MIARVVRGENVRAKTLDTRDHLNHFARDETAGNSFHVVLIYKEKRILSKNSRRSRVSDSVCHGVIRDQIVLVIFHLLNGLEH